MEMKPPHWTKSHLLFRNDSLNLDLQFSVEASKLNAFFVKMCIMTYKLAHLSDIHADYRSSNKRNNLGINVREADGYLALQRMITDVIDHDVDGVVVAGDVFHSPSPTMRAIVFVQNQLRKLWAAKIPVYMLAGNHDTKDVASDVAASKILNDPWRKIYSHVEPYSKHEIADGIHLHLVSHHMYAEQHHTMQQVKPVPGEINIFSTHGSCIDPLLKEKLKAQQSPREIVIPDFLLKNKDWNYALLGHIHERGWVGSDDKMTDTSNTKIYYNGSLIRRGFADKDVPLGRGWTLWEIDSDGTFTHTIKQVPQRPQFDFPLIDAQELTHSEVSQKIIKNLQTTQINGTEYNVKNAPILRQKVVNLTSAKQMALDKKAINAEAEHSLIWDLDDKTFNEVNPNDNNNTVDNVNQDLKSADVVEVYKQWVTDSEYLNTQVSDEQRPIIENKAQEFITNGQEIILDKE